MTKAEALELLKKPFLHCYLKCYSQSEENCGRCEQAFDMAIEALQQDKVLCLGNLDRKCKHCTVKGETKHYCYCDIWGSVVNPRGWCNYGERDEIEQDEEQAAIEQLEHDIKYEPTFSNDDGSM